MYFTCIENEISDIFISSIEQLLYCKYKRKGIKLKMDGDLKPMECNPDYKINIIVIWNLIKQQQFLEENGFSFYGFKISDISQ